MKSDSFPRAQQTVKALAMRSKIYTLKSKKQLGSLLIKSSSYSSSSSLPSRPTSPTSLAKIC